MYKIYVSHISGETQNDTGRVYQYRLGGDGKTFTSWQAFERYIKRFKHLDSVMAFSTSPDTNNAANAYIRGRRLV